MKDGERYATIRDVIGDFIGLRIVDITQHDKEDFERDGVSFIAFHFEDGRTLCFYIDDENGFEIVDDDTIMGVDDVEDDDEDESTEGA